MKNASSVFYVSLAIMTGLVLTPNRDSSGAKEEIDSKPEISVKIAELLKVENQMKPISDGISRLVLR